MTSTTLIELEPQEALEPQKAITIFKRPTLEKVEKSARDNQYRRNTPKQPNGVHKLARDLIDAAEKKNK